MAVDGTPQRWPVQRLLFLTDGVVAIALTLLALDLRPSLPASGHDSSNLGHALWAQRDQYVSFVIAFFVIASYWAAHHRIMRAVDEADALLAQVNILFLFSITLVPTVAYIDGGYGGSLANTLLAANLLLASVLVTALQAVVRRHHLARDEADGAQDQGWAHGVVYLAVPLIVIALSWIVPDHASWAWFLLLLANAPRRLRRPPRRPSGDGSRR